MVLCESLADTDIPRRDRMREAVISQWRDSFEQLISDLSVSIGMLSLCFIDFISLAIEILRADQFHFRCLVKREP